MIFPFTFCNLVQRLTESNFRRFKPTSEVVAKFKRKEVEEFNETDDRSTQTESENSTKRSWKNKMYQYIEAVLAQNRFLPKSPSHVINTSRLYLIHEMSLKWTLSVMTLLKFKSPLLEKISIRDCISLYLKNNKLLNRWKNILEDIVESETICRYRLDRKTLQKKNSVALILKL